jgi:class 3 adenylate cyclase
MNARITDGVLCIFGEPFAQTTPDLVFEVVELAKQLIKHVHKWFDAEVCAKVAIARGECFVGYVGPDEHRELTVIGNPLTTAFRLEAICDVDQIKLPRELFESRPAKRVRAITNDSGTASWSVTSASPVLAGIGEMDVTTITWAGGDPA